MQYIAMQPILDLCERSTRRPGARVSWRWWEQAVIYLEGTKKREAEAATALESEWDRIWADRSRVEQVG